VSGHQAEPEVEGADELDEFDDALPTARSRTLWWPGILGAAVALVLVVAAVLIYANRGDSTSTPGDNSAEAGFSRDMAVHHEQAVEMAFIVRDDTDNKEVRDFAYDIANTQANQRGMMLGWLDLWGLTPTSSTAPMAWMGMSAYKAHDGSLMPGMATNTQMDELRNAKGKTAEVLFLHLMIAHHKGGIDMAQGVLDMSKNHSVDRLATTIVQGQMSEIDQMNTMLKERGEAPVQ
jgi:uncharacterized protein (DUF305 family)